MLTILAIAALTFYVSQYVSLYTDDGILSISISYCEFQRDLEEAWSLTKAAYEWTIDLIQALNSLFQEIILPMLPVQSKDESVEMNEDESIEDSMLLGIYGENLTADELKEIHDSLGETEQDISDEELKAFIGEEIYNQFFSKSHSYNEDTEEQPETI